MTQGWDFTDPSNIKQRDFEWNADNMPVEISYGGGEAITTLLYDGIGSRARKEVVSGGATIYTYYFGDHYEIDGGVEHKYIFAGNLRVAQIEGSSVSYFHKDHLGSSTLMTNSSGAQIESTNYEPFGGVRDHTGTDTSNYDFTDQELDAENGLYNYGARLYDPIIGRFISPDTIVQAPYNPQSLNRYSYCLNNPLIYVDPSGYSPLSWEDYKTLFGYQYTTTTWVNGELCIDTVYVYPSEQDYISYLEGYYAATINNGYSFNYYPTGIGQPGDPPGVTTVIDIDPPKESDTATKNTGSTPGTTLLEVVKTKFMKIAYPTKEMQNHNPRLGIAYDKQGNITNIDCSNLVYQAHKAAGLSYAAYSLTVAEFVEKHPHYQKTNNPLAGDLMVFYDEGEGIHHMGFYDPNSPKAGWTILGATSSKGVRYGKPTWWNTTPEYYRYVP